jgi:hypothetical protein
MNDQERGDRRLTQALRVLADADATAGASPAVEARLREAVRAIGEARRHPRAGFLAIAAALAAVAGGSTWLVARYAPEPARAVVTREVATEFLPLAYGHLPVTDAYIVRLEVPRSALIQFGLAGPDLPQAVDETVDADVLVGLDGIARAVRFVHHVGSEE